MKTSMSKTLLAAVAAAYVLAGCANMTEEQRAAAIGAGVGALAGVAVGDKDHKGQSAAIGAGVGALGGYIWSQQMEKKKQAMQQATAGTGATVTQTSDNLLKVNIPSDLSFDTGSYAIKSNMRPVLDQFASGLSGQNYDVRIIGHTDNTGSYAINQPLSVNRANSVRDYLGMRGVNTSRISTSGVADTQPVASNANEYGRAQNRRVEIFLGQKG